MKFELLPFPIGSTFQGGNTSLDGSHLEGKEYQVEDRDFSVSGSTPNALRSNRIRTLRVVKNVSGITILPKRYARYKRTAGTYLFSQVDGYGTVTGDAPGSPVDEFLTAGCPANDWCYVCLEGPAAFLTDLAGGASNVINVNDVIVGLTAATSQATTAGRVASQDLTGATAVLGVQILGAIGRALSAKTTGNTNADILVDVVRRW